MPEITDNDSKELVDKSGLSEGGKFEIYEQEGIICIMPVVVYPKGYIEKILKDVEETKQKVVAGELPVFDTAGKLIAGLESED